MADMGVSFLPIPQGGPQNQGQPSVDPTQTAIKILSLRLPHVVGGGALAPSPLLNGIGAQGNPFSQSAVGQTQQRLLPDPLGAGLPSAPAGGGLSGGSITGATSPGLGNIPPDMLLRVLQLLAGGNLAGGGTNSPSPTRIIPGGESRHPNPIGDQPTPPIGPAPPNIPNPSPIPDNALSQPPATPGSPVSPGSGGRWPWTPGSGRGPGSF